ncbi:hypothetical protein TNCV_1868771 [Trichonephila clavipes]|nr:hypothetical protein TNCV_1868771 [Trichonephila clavipes]
MSSRHDIDDFMRGRIIGKIEERRKITDVAREFDIAHSVVSRLWKSFKTNCHIPINLSTPTPRNSLKRTFFFGNEPDGRKDLLSTD